MDRSQMGKLLVGVGLALVLAGVVLFVTGDDGDTPADASPTTTTSTSTTSTPTTSTASTTTTSSTTTTTVPVVEESATDFFALLRAALDGGDPATLVDRMNPATIERYGLDQCETYAASVAGTGLDAEVVAMRDLASWDYVTDGVSTVLTDVVEADLERTVNGQVVPQTTHWQLVDGRYTWFTDCGSPV
jgi:hypothetical protein